MKSINRRGFVLIIIAFKVLVLSLTFVGMLVEQSYDEYSYARKFADRTKAKFLAKSGQKLVIKTIESINNINLLYEFGFFSFPWEISLGGGSISFVIDEESGRFNLNHLVRFNSDDPNLRQRDIANRLLEVYHLPIELWDAVVDYIDKNNQKMPQGFEKLEYLQMTPAREIRNSRMSSLQELLLIPGFDHKLLYEDLRTEKEKETTSSDFLGDLERLSITDDDYILANQLTTVVSANPNVIGNDKININTAPYHVILALSEFMTPDAASALVKKRLIKRFTGKEDLKSIPEMNRTTKGKVFLYQEIEPIIKYEDSLYTIRSRGALLGASAEIIVIYDVMNRKLIRYSE